MEITDREKLCDLSGCSLPFALEVMGERWSFLILRAALSGVHHFEDFQSTLGIARNILANRLARLVDNGILNRRPMQNDRRKVEYRLTDKGRGLVPVMVALRQWGEQWGGVPCTALLVDARDHKPVKNIAVLSHDGRELAPDEMMWLNVEEEAAMAIMRSPICCDA